MDISYICVCLCVYTFPLLINYFSVAAVLTFSCLYNSDTFQLALDIDQVTSSNPYSSSGAGAPRLIFFNVEATPVYFLLQLEKSHGGYINIIYFFSVWVVFFFPVHIFPL